MENSLFFVPKKKKFSLLQSINEPTKVINIMKDKSIEHLYVGRGSVFGNPYTHKESKLAKHKTNNREESVKKYYQHILSNENLLKQAKGLHGETLGCFCYPKMCHADVLALIADSSKINEPIENNYKFNNCLVISENQNKIIDERRLALLAEVTESEFIFLKKKGDISGNIVVNEKSAVIGNQISWKSEKGIFGEGLHLFMNNSINPQKEMKIINVHFENSHYLTPIFSLFGKELNQFIVAKNESGIITEVFN